LTNEIYDVRSPPMKSMMLDPHQWNLWC